MREKGEGGERGRGRPNSVGAYAKSPGSLIAPDTGCFTDSVAIFVKLNGRSTKSKVKYHQFWTKSVGWEDETALCFTSSSPPIPKEYVLFPGSQFLCILMSGSLTSWPSLIFPPLSISHLLYDTQLFFCSLVGTS